MSTGKFASVSVRVATGVSGEDSWSIIAAIEKLAGADNVEVLSSNDFEIAEKSDGASAGFWLCINPDDEAPYCATRHGEMDGHELTEAMIVVLQLRAVASRVLVHYPRADRYGVPDVAVQSVCAAGEAAEHGFRLTDNFELEAIDTQDDSAMTMWFYLEFDPSGLGGGFEEAGFLALMGG